MNFFSPPAKGYFVELNEHGTLLARTSAPTPPFAVEEVREVARGDQEGLGEAIRQLQPKKSPSGYLQASVAIYPEQRVLRRHSIDLKRVKEAGYLEEICNQQFRIDLEKYMIAVLRSDDGSNFDVNAAAQKDILFCGMPIEDIHSAQDMLLQARIYPERLELGTVGALGAMVDYLAHINAKTPTLVLEIGADSTHSFVVSNTGVEAARPISHGLESMVPVVQKELGLKDEESAKKLFYSNTFDFTGMGPLLIKRLIKDLQSSIGFYEVQTGQSVGQVLTTQLAPKLAWLEVSIASALGISPLKLDAAGWLKTRNISLASSVATVASDIRWFGLFALMSRYQANHDLSAEEKK